MLGAIGVGSLEDLFADIPEGVRLGPRHRPAGRPLRAGGARPPGRAGRPQPPLRRRDQLPGRRHVRPLRAGADRQPALALGVPHPVHALPARDLPGRAAGDVRVPDRDLRADRAAGVERLGLRGPERRGGRGLPGQARDPAHEARGQPRPASALARRAAHPRGGLRHGGGGGAARRRRRHRRRGARRRASTTTPPRVFVQQPNFLGTVEELGELAEAAREAGRGGRLRRRPAAARDPQAARRAGRGHLRGRGPDARQPARLRRPVVRLLRRRRALPAQDAGPDRRRDARRATAGAASCSRCRRASSTSAARRPRTTSAPPRR